MSSQANEADRQELASIPKNVLIIYDVSQAKASTTLTYKGHNLGNNADFGPVTKAIFVPVDTSDQYTAAADPGAGGLSATAKLPSKVDGDALTWLEDDDGNRSCTMRSTFAAPT